MNALNKTEQTALIRGLQRLKTEQAERFDDALKDYLNEELPSDTMAGLIEDLEEIRQEYLALDVLLHKHRTEGLI